MRLSTPISLTLFLAAVAHPWPLMAKKQAEPPLPPVVLTGVGYAPISTQPASTDEGRRLLAIRASQLAAMRNLAEQLYGARVQANSATTGSAVKADSIRSTVGGVVTGARIVKITPKGDDTYETVLEMTTPQPVAHR